MITIEKRQEFVVIEQRDAEGSMCAYLILSSRELLQLKEVIDTVLSK